MLNRCRRHRSAEPSPVTSVTPVVRGLTSALYPLRALRACDPHHTRMFNFPKSSATPAEPALLAPPPPSAPPTQSPTPSRNRHEFPARLRSFRLHTAQTSDTHSAAADSETEPPPPPAPTPDSQSSLAGLPPTSTTRPAPSAQT